MINENKIVGLYIDSVLHQTIIKYTMLVIYKGGLLYKSPRFKLNIDEIQDLSAYSGSRMIEFYIKDTILETFTEEQYILMSKEDIDLASEQIEFLKKFIQRDLRINLILS